MQCLAAARLQEEKKLQLQHQHHARKLQTRRPPERVGRAAAEKRTMQENNVDVFDSKHVVQKPWVRRGVRPSLRCGSGPTGAVLGRGRPGRRLVPAVESDAARPGSGVPELVGERVSSIPPQGGGAFPFTLSVVMQLSNLQFETVTKGLLLKPEVEKVVFLG